MQRLVMPGPETVPLIGRLLAVYFCNSVLLRVWGRHTSVVVWCSLRGGSRDKRVRGQHCLVCHQQVVFQPSDELPSFSSGQRFWHSFSRTPGCDVCMVIAATMRLLTPVGVLHMLDPLDAPICAQDSPGGCGMCGPGVVIGFGLRVVDCTSLSVNVWA